MGQAIQPHGAGRGLTEADIGAAIARQGGVCLTCQRPPIDRWDIDHDHKCIYCGGLKGCRKCFRGMLCRPCNSALGFVNDDTDTLERMIVYLKLAKVPRGR